MQDRSDGLKIGMIITEALLNQGNINSSAIGKEYDLKLRLDLTAQSVGVLNVGITDDTSVYEVVERNVQAINTLLQNAKDPFNSAIATMDVEHYEIHEGDHFFYSSVQAVAGNATIDYILEVKSKPAHFVFSIIGNDAGISGTSYENIVSDNNGTLVTPINNNRLSTNISTVVNRVNPTNIVITGATLLRNFRGGTGGTPSTRKAGSVERSREVILKPNTKYLIRTTNLSTSTNNISFDFSWYEL